MKRYVIIGFIVLASVLIIIKIGENNKQIYPNDFNFTYSYGVNGVESIDTYSNTLKYSSVNGIIELKFELSVEEKNKIYTKMQDSDFMGVSSSFPLLSTVDIPIIKYSKMRVEYNNMNNEVSWNTRNFNILNYDNPTNGNEELRTINELGEFINQIINERLKSIDLPDKPLYL